MAVSLSSLVPVSSLSIFTILVFPGSENKISDPYRFTKDGRLLWIYMLHMDLNSEGWEEKLAVEFRDHFSAILAKADQIADQQKGVKSLKSVL